jgi:hypothetical protein
MNLGEQQEDDIKMNFRLTGSEDVDCVLLANNNDKWWALVESVINSGGFRGIS